MKPILCLTALSLSAGIAALFACGGEPPGWLLRLECASAAIAACAYGFSDVSLRNPDWPRPRLARGAIFIHLGIACVFINSSFLFSTAFMGAGLRMLVGELRQPELARDSAAITTTG